MKKIDLKKFYDVHEILERMGYNPVEALVRIAMNDTLDYSLRLKATIVLADKTIPSLKNVEHKRNDDQHAESLNTLKQIFQSICDLHVKEC
jgi:hypothetical protein